MLYDDSLQYIVIFLIVFCFTHIQTAIMFLFMQKCYVADH